jgi:dTDP-4-dehydrorhamnose 3,5-epimerase
MFKNLPVSWGMPAGIKLSSLATHRDSRGNLTEIFRREWQFEIEPVQWNYVNSEANVLRGVHVHHQHIDYLLLCQGCMSLGLCDIRESSPTFGTRFLLELTDQKFQLVVIPTGVAHGFYFPSAASIIYGVSHYWDLKDELGCKWDDPELNLPWPAQTPNLSQRDLHAGTLHEMCLAYQDACNTVS